MRTAGLEKALAITAGAVIALVGLAWTTSGTLSRAVRARALRELEDRFESNIQLTSMEVRVFPLLEIRGEGLTLLYKGRQDLPPLISIHSFSATAGLQAWLRGHISRLRLDGLEIQVPPRNQSAPREPGTRHRKIAGFIVDEIVADGAILKTLPANPEKEPLVWEIHRLTLHDAGPNSPMSFRATLINAKPPGEIATVGRFGPWQAESPGDTPVDGDYTFQNADLVVFRGLAGTLSSAGDFHGVLDRIEVQGTTDTPNFMVKMSGNSVHLKTQFQAVVDGTDGDTLLKTVNGQFDRSSIVARGEIAGTKGIKGKTVSLDIVVDHGRVEDMLRLGVKGATPMMNGGISFRAKLVIPPGEVDIAKKLNLQGRFTVASALFTKTELQEKINMLSHRGEGEPKEPASDTVASDFAGQFKMDKGTMTLTDVSFQVPGIRVALNGQYGLLDEQLDFHGTAKIDARLSQMTTGFKSFLLKAVDPFFKKGDAGTVLPIKITGTREKPSFGLDRHPGANARN